MYSKLLNYTMIVFLIVSFSISKALAQSTIKVTYEASQQIDLDEISIMGVNAKNTNLADALLDAQNVKYPYELLLNKENSSFKPLAKISNSQTSEKINVVMNPSGNHLYKNLVENYYVEENSFYNKQFRIKEPLPVYDWKLENEKKEILGYEVRKATALVDSVKILTAWYAPKLAYKDGPRNIWGLPGLILEVEVSSTKTKEITKMKAIEVSVLDDSDKASTIEQPQKGKFITREEFLNFSKEYDTKQREFFNQGVETD